MSRCLCHVVFVRLSLSRCFCPVVFVRLSLSRCLYHVVFVTLSLSSCLCHVVFVTLSLSGWLCHVVLVTLCLSGCPQTAMSNIVIVFFYHSIISPQSVTFPYLSAMMFSSYPTVTKHYHTCLLSCCSLTMIRNIVLFVFCQFVILSRPQYLTMSFCLTQTNSVTTPYTLTDSIDTR